MSSPGNNQIMKPPFRSEAIYACLLESGASTNDIKVNYRGSFKKSYSNDVETLSRTETEGKQLFNITINRDGIYDKLPEGLFHQTKGNSKIKTVQDAVDEHKNFKEEERLARKFFAPLEQILFRYGSYLEVAERDALYNIQNGKLNESFYHFWNIPTSLPKKEAGRLLQLMPYVHYLKGDGDATAIAIGYILNKKVTLTKEDRFSTNLLNESLALHEVRLGMNSVTGEKNKELAPSWIFTIEAPAIQELQYYINNSTKDSLLQKISDIFIPLDVDVIFEFNTAHVTNNNIIESILGYGAHI